MKSKSEGQISFVLNDGKIVIGAGRVARSRRLCGGTGVIGHRGRSRLTHSDRIRGFRAGKVDIVGHDLDSSAVVAVLILIGAGLQATVNDDQRTLLEITADKLCAAIPRNDVQEIRLALAIGILAPTVTSNAERRDVLPVVV